MNVHEDYLELRAQLGQADDVLLAMEGREIDQLAATCSLDRQAHRALRDPWYRHVLREMGRGGLTPAGFVDDGALIETLADHAAQARLMTTPLDKVRRNLAACDPALIPAVIVSTGAYSPVHEGHVAVAERSRAAVEAAGRAVVGGYLSASHDAYVQRKNDDVHECAELRLLRVERMVAASDWLSCDPWEARFIGAAVNFTDVVAHLENYLEAHLGRPVEVWYAFGADNAAFAHAFARCGRCVIVGRAGSEQRAAEVLDHARLADAAREGRVLLAPAHELHAAVSSTQLRASGAGQGAQRPAGTWYAIRDDLHLACSAWPLDQATIRMPLARFADRVAALLEGSLAADVPVVRVSVERQYELSRAALAGRQAVHIDAFAPAGAARLDLCRRFDLSDGQVHAREILSRPEATLAQAPAPSGHVTVVDDDIVSGCTVEHARSVLEGRCQVDGAISLLDLSQADMGLIGPELDVVDMRDFALGAAYGGLACEMDMRAPYMQPYVRLAARASTQPQQEMPLSIGLWRANEALHAELEALGQTMHVGDCPPPARSLLERAGFNPGNTLRAVCAWHAEQLERLPHRRPATRPAELAAGAR